MPTEETDWGALGAGALRRHSPEDIAAAIAEALSTLAGTPLSVRLDTIDFQLFRNVRVTLTIDAAMNEPA